MRWFSSCTTKKNVKKKLSVWVSFKIFFLPPRQEDESSSGIEFEVDSNASETIPSEDVVDTPRQPSERIQQVLYIQMEFCEKHTLRQAIDSGLYQEHFRAWRLFRYVFLVLASTVIYSNIQFSCIRLKWKPILEEKTWQMVLAWTVCTRASFYFFNSSRWFWAYRQFFKMLHPRLHGHWTSDGIYYSLVYYWVIIKKNDQP